MKYVNGNLLKMFKNSEFQVVVHGCNIFHTFGSGIAAQIKKEYPEAYDSDLCTEYGDTDKLGMFSLAHYLDITDKVHIIVNLYTQGSFGKTGVHVDYEAIERGFKAIKVAYGNMKIGIPQIGAGLGGGDWNRIETIIDSIGFTDITCVLYDGT